ncbi:MAG: MSCRAMM family protein [Myxococcota bacterium]
MRRWIVALGVMVCVACDGGPSVGAVEGEVAPAEALPVVMALAEGDVVAEERANRETGRFRLEVPPGTYDLVATAEGYVPDDSVRGLEVQRGDTASVEPIVLFRAGTGSVSGRVEPSGAEATVSAMQFGAVIASTGTDEDGGFLLTDLPVGTYELVVSAPGYHRYEADEGVRVREGTTVSLDPITLEMRTTPTGSIEGVVSPAEAGATVTALRDGVPEASTGASTDDGGFRIDGLEPGTYDLSVTAPGYGEARVEAVAVEGEAVADAGEVQLVEPTRLLVGTVVDQDTRAPVPGVEVTVGGESGRTGSDGRFRVADPAPGTSTLRMERPYYIPASRLVTVPEEGTAELELELAASGRVSGAVQSEGGTPLADAVVEGGDAAASTNAAGEYLLVHLRPGRYEVRARASGYAIGTTVVDVDAGTTVQADLALTQAGTVQGRVVQEGTDTGVPNAVITVGGVAAASGSDGYYEVTPVPAGNHVLRVSAEHYDPAERNVEVPPGGSAVQDVPLAPVPRVEVTGRVTAPDGEPVEGAWIRFGSGYDLDDYTDVDGYYTVPASSGELVPVDVTTVTVSGTGFPRTNREVDLRTGSSPVSLDIVIDEYASIAGRLVDSATGEGIVGERVYCGGSATTVGDGLFAVPQVVPGEYSCYVQASDCYPYQPLELEPLESGEHRQVTLLAERKADVLVTVRDAGDLSTVGGAEVWTSLPSRTIEAVATGDGVATLPCVDAGEQVVYGWHTGYSSGASRVRVPESGEVQAWVDLEPAP